MMPAKQGLIVIMTENDIIGAAANPMAHIVKVAQKVLPLSWAVELEAHGIAVVALTPGFLRSESMLDHFAVTEDTWREAGRKDPNLPRVRITTVRRTTSRRRAGGRSRDSGTHRHALQFMGARAGLRIHRLRWPSSRLGSPPDRLHGPAARLDSVHPHEYEPGAQMAHDACGARPEISREDPILKTDRARSAIVGVAEHGNSAILVTVAPGGKILDRRRVDLTSGLPTHPYHHEGSWAVGRYMNSSWARPISLEAAVALIERVHTAAACGARASLEALVATVPMPIAGISIRTCAKLPPTIGEKAPYCRHSREYPRRLRHVSRGAGDGSQGAGMVGALVRPRAGVFHEAKAALCESDDLDAFLHAMGRTDWAALAGQTQACGGSGACGGRRVR